MYIDGRLKAFGNIARLINSTQPITINKQPSFIFEGCGGNRVFLYAIKEIISKEELLVDYYLNWIDTTTNIMGVLMLYHFNQPPINALSFLSLTFFNISCLLCYNVSFSISYARYIVEANHGKASTSQEVNDWQYRFHLMWNLLLFL